MLTLIGPVTHSRRCAGHSARLGLLNMAVLRHINRDQDAGPLAGRADWLPLAMEQAVNCDAHE